MGRVAIKGKNFLGFEIEVYGNDEPVFNELEKALAVSKHYISNSIVTIRLDDKSKSIAPRIVSFLKDREVAVNAVVVESKENLNIDLPIIEIKDLQLLNQQAEKEVSTFRGNLRSGQSIKTNGDLVVVGNVNSNSYIYATGNIFVLGKLYGVPHAGYGGNNEAIIFAFDLNPPQIRIGDFITRSPEENLFMKRKNVVPEVAYVDEGAIVISPYEEWRKIKWE
ncbi:septum site-determining protein MinC [Hippea jasoniae]|uniref:septum site-determining protein MinC n=1 Tax=Hippea jasoniae TaxID=944479 RepID=UPI00068BC0C1|nr:septum site-determining protein MinC [Hippea jasoniae]